MKISIGFENGTHIEDTFTDSNDFNSWVEIAIQDFGKITCIEILSK